MTECYDLDNYDDVDVLLSSDQDDDAYEDFLSSKYRKSGDLNKLEKAWAYIFEKHNVLSKIKSNDKGIVILTAKQLSESGVPVQSLVRINTAKDRPIMFKEHGLNIIPIRVDEFLIGKFKLFEDLKPPTHVKEVVMNSNYSTIDLDKRLTETQIISIIELTGIILDFTGNYGIRQCFSGKESRGTFNIELDNGVPIRVSGGQTEIDAGYESNENIYIAEVKAHVFETFNIRQLYYPYRKYTEKYEKPVKLLFINYSSKTQTVNMYEYKFTQKLNIGSIKLVKSTAYKITKHR